MESAACWDTLDGECVCVCTCVYALVCAREYTLVCLYEIYTQLISSIKLLKIQFNPF